MKIVARILVSLAGAVALVAGAMAGCSTTNNLNSGGGTSDIGETCTRTFDCKSGLVCEQNVCLKAAPTTTADGGVIPVGDSGTAPGPHLGLLNESCQTSADCQSPFECINQSCSIVSYGLTVTGNTCQECKTAADCCELPVGVGLTPGFYLSQWYTQAVDGGVYTEHGANGVTGPGAQELLAESIRCQDLLAFMGGDPAICADSADFTVNENGLSSACFLYHAYCGSCATSPPWACNSGQCSYTAPCLSTGTTAAMLASACPAASRTRSGFTTTCASPDGGVGGTCTAGCAVDSDCSGKTPADGNHACAVGDAGGSNCSCFQSACYFTCASDLDCAAGKSCDTTMTHLCKAQACAADADCVQSLRNPQGKCMAGACTVACAKDTDCSPPTSICSAGACMTSGCTSDLNCTSGSVHSFCVKAPAAAATYSSAVTN